MGQLYNIYCDESCHLIHDTVNSTAMVIGGILCPDNIKKEVASRLKEIKKRHGIAEHIEIKWNKVSPAMLGYYLDLVDYFFDNTNLHFRAVVIPDKSTLRCEDFGHTPDDFYYKTYFNMLKTMLEPGSEYAIYIDIKDTRSQQKVEKLHEVLCNNSYDFNRHMITRVQQIRSHEVELMGLTDLLIGAVSYLHRGLTQSPTKLAIIDRIKKRSGYTLENSTLYREDKFNLLIWRQRNGTNR